MVKLNDIKTPIKKELKKFNLAFPKYMNSNIPLLNILTKYIIRRKGKQIRPMLVFLTAKMLGETNSSTFTAASLIELLHTATLIHDDVVDESYERRGFLSINALWKSKIAVLLGDFLLSKGLLLSLENNEYDQLQIVSEAVREMSEGELLQIQNSRKLNITESLYYEITRKKTAALIAACTTCGARSVTKDTTVLKDFKKFGENVGMAFQIKDDLLDYENSNLIGKPTGNDIKEKKVTLPLIYALEHAVAKDRKHIIHLIRKKNNKTKAISEIITYVKNKGGIEYAVSKMNAYKDTAVRILDKFENSQSRQALIELVNFTITRNK